MKKEDITIIELTFVNAFLIKAGNRFILIDTGLGEHWQKLESELLSAGSLPDKLNLIIITHGDFDHTGNCAKLQQKYKCKIAMHQADVSMAEEAKRSKRKVRTLKAKIFFLIRRLRRRKFTFDRFKPDIYLTDGQNLKEYGLNAEIVHIPGHTKGSIGILTDSGDLFAGDIFTNVFKPDLATYIENSHDLKNSFEKLKKMSIKTIYPGHGKPFEMEQIAHKI
jgi:hydroxyacylglutathione hydrolase